MPMEGQSQAGDEAQHPQGPRGTGKGKAEEK